MPERLTASGERDRRFRSAEDPYVPPEKPSPPVPSPEELAEADARMLAQMLSDVAADIVDAKARYEMLTDRRYRLIQLAGTMMVDGKPVTDEFISRYAGVNSRRANQIRHQRHQLGSATNRPEPPQ